MFLFIRFIRICVSHQKSRSYIHLSLIPVQNSDIPGIFFLVLTKNNLEQLLPQRKYLIFLVSIIQCSNDAKSCLHHRAATATLSHCLYFCCVCMKSSQVHFVWQKQNHLLYCCLKFLFRFYICIKVYVLKQ